MLQEFNGRVYATGNPQACFELGTGQTEISLRIPIGTQCGSVQSVGGPANIIRLSGKYHSNTGLFFCLPQIRQVQ